MVREEVKRSEPDMAGETCLQTRVTPTSDLHNEILHLLPGSLWLNPL